MFNDEAVLDPNEIADYASYYGFITAAILLFAGAVWVYRPRQQEAADQRSEDAGGETSPEIHNNLGRIHLRNGELDEAQIKVEQVIDALAESGLPAIAERYGLSYRFAGKAEEQMRTLADIRHHDGIGSDPGIAPDQVSSMLRPVVRLRDNARYIVGFRNVTNGDGAVIEARDRLEGVQRRQAELDERLAHEASSV